MQHSLNHLNTLNIEILHWQAFAWPVTLPTRTSPYLYKVGPFEKRGNLSCTLVRSRILQSTIIYNLLSQILSLCHVRTKSWNVPCLPSYTTCFYLRLMALIGSVTSLWSLLPVRVRVVGHTSTLLSEHLLVNIFLLYRAYGVWARVRHVDPQYCGQVVAQRRQENAP